MQHAIIPAAGAEFHVVTAGSGPALLLLHGWPEYWQTWQPVMDRLSDRFTLIAPDLRGFGTSSKPAGPWGADDHARDLLAVLDAMGVDRAGVVGHDVGGPVAMSLARMAPARWPGLFFFDFAHPAIGARMGAPERLIEIWYQSFHQMDMAPDVVGASREACRAYFSHFLHHWCYRKDTFDDVLEDWVDNFMRPGNLAGGFAWYRATHAGRIASMQGAKPPPPITLPTCVRWAEYDPMFPYTWTDTLDQVFTDLDFAMFPGVGHFPHREDPDQAAKMIAEFFTGRA